MMKRILVAEDDVHTRAALEEIIRSEGYDVTAVGDGLSAKRAIDSSRFDLLCLDVMMPMHSGFDVCRFVRGQDTRTPIIFITAKGEEIDKVVGFELGADDYISKPFGAHEVIARIKAVLRRCSPDAVPSASPAEPTSHAPFQMDDLVIYPAKLQACRNEIELKLTSRELQILILLYEAEGEVVSRRVLYQRCWESTGIPNSRTVDQTVSQLRKRIELDTKQPRIIQTVHGVGYRHEQ